MKAQSGLQVILSALSIYRDHMALLVMTAAGPHLGSMLVEYLISFLGEPAGGVMVLGVMINSVLNALALAALTVAITHSLFGREPMLGTILASTMNSGLLQVILAYIFSVMVISAGLMVFLVPGILIGAVLSVVIPVVVVERLKFIPAVQRSVEMIRQGGGMLLGVPVFLFYLLVSGIVPFLVLLMQVEPGEAMAPLTPLLVAAVGSATLPLGFSANVALYLSLRAREGGTEQQILSDLGITAGKQNPA